MGDYDSAIGRPDVPFVITQEAKMEEKPKENKHGIRKR